MAEVDTDTDLKGVLAQLRRASKFEEAAASTLRPMLSLAARALAASEFAAVGRIVRGMIHLRPGDGYRRLVVLESGADALSAIGTSNAHLPSATAWRWVAARGHPVAIDVNLGRVTLDDRDPSAVVSDARFCEAEFSSQESRVRLLDRDVTHLFVLPLRGVRGGIDGMISLEADCRAAMGRPFVWSACSADLGALADLAAPYLLELPSGPSPAVARDAFLPVVGSSMTEIIEMLRVFAVQDEPILLAGPTGAGKSRLARWCHEQSALRQGPFEAVDLSAIPEEVQLAELFGWKKGAFTGSVRDNPGVIARARGGTLFLDEIDNLSSRAQAGLLRVLEERSYRMLGDDGAERRAEVRFIVGTNANLQEAVRARQFREDLYYRINVLPVRLPPLDGRPEEIPMWAEYMATRRHEQRVQGGTARLSAGAGRLLLSRSWPGNLRQLDNIVRRAHAVALTAHGSHVPRELVLEEGDVQRALAYECAGALAPRGTLDALLAAAAAIVDEAERRAGDSLGGQEPLDVDLVEGFMGLVLAIATERAEGDRDEAFRLLGKAKLVKARNHYKVLKRELERAEQLCAALGVRFPFDALVPGPGTEPS